MKGRSPEYAPLLVDGDRDQHDGYSDGLDRLYDEPSTPGVVATGSAGLASVEEVVVGKKDKRGKSASSPALLGEENPSWS
jgi:hypothetical protein